MKKLLLKQKLSDDEENLVPLSGAIFITIIFGGLSLVLGLVLGSTFCPIVESTSANFYLKNQEINLQKQVYTELFNPANLTFNVFDTLDQQA